MKATFLLQSIQFSFVIKFINVTLLSLIWIESLDTMSCRLLSSVLSNEHVILVDFAVASCSILSPPSRGREITNCEVIVSGQQHSKHTIRRENSEERERMNVSHNMLSHPAWPNCCVDYRGLLEEVCLAWYPILVSDLDWWLLECPQYPLAIDWM